MGNLDKKIPKRLDRKIIYESEWISLYVDKVQMPSGKIIPAYHRLHYPYASVSCVIANERNEILMIQSRRYATNRLEWEVPAGRIELDETPRQAAMRECMEETGCIIKDLTFLCEQNPSNGMSDLTMYVFAAKVDRENDILDEDEVSEKRWVPINEVKEMLKDNKIHCGVSMLSLLFAIQFYFK